MRHAGLCADDLVAATLRSIQPGALEAAKRRAALGEQREIPDSLDGLARQTLAELVTNVMQADDAANAAAIWGHTLSNGLTAGDTLAALLAAFQGVQAVDITRVAGVDVIGTGQPSTDPWRGSP